MKTLILKIVCCAGLLLSLNQAALGHHIWIGKSKTTGKVNIYFGEEPSPDQDMFLAGIKDMRVWSIDKQGNATKLPFTHQTKDKDGWYETTTGLAAVDADCEYGVFGRGGSGMFLHYSAKWIEHKPGHSRAATGNLMTDIVMNESGSKTTFTVLHNNKPAAGCELRIIEADDTQHDLTANDKGEVVFDKTPSGRWMLKARVVVEEGGELDGKKFADKRYFCTMVLDAASSKSVAKKDAKMKETHAAATNPARMLKQSSPFPELPIGITSFGGAVVDDHVYVFGGHSGESHDYYREGQNAKLMSLNLKSPEKWTEVAKSTGMQGLAMVEHGGKLYRVGGFEARNDQGEDQNLHSVAEFARFNFETKKWEPLQAMPTPRSSLDAVVVGDTLHVVGGWTMKGKEKTEWCENAVSIDLSDKDAKWQEIKVPFLRRALSVGFQGDALYAVGGMRQKGGPTTEVMVYDMAKKAWTNGPALPGSGRMAGFGSSCFNVGGKLIVSTYDGSVLQLNSDQSGWEKIHEFETGRFFHRLLPTADDKFILVGGANMESGHLCDVPLLSFN